MFILMLPISGTEIGFELAKLLMVFSHHCNLGTRRQGSGSINQKNDVTWQQWQNPSCHRGCCCCCCFFFAATAGAVAVLLLVLVLCDVCFCGCCCCWWCGLPVVVAAWLLFLLLPFLRLRTCLLGSVIETWMVPFCCNSQKNVHEKNHQPSKRINSNLVVY